MKERGILFSAKMIKKILSGEKTQTRRVVKELGGNRGGPVGPHVKWFERGREDPTRWCGMDGLGSLGWVRCPYGEPGDRLWVRETWQAIKNEIPDDFGKVYAVEGAASIPKQRGIWSVAFAADDSWKELDAEERGFSWRPGIHMPRWASRILLEVEDVGVERLSAISEVDALAEGVAEDLSYPDGPNHPPTIERSARDAYFELWAEINGKASLDADPWVWVVDFRRIG